MDKQELLNLGVIALGLRIWNSTTYFRGKEKLLYGYFEKPEIKRQPRLSELEIFDLLQNI